MSQPTITSAEVPDEWIADVRSILSRDGNATRGPATPIIEVKSLRTNEWCKLMLPGSGFHFASTDERDAVLRRLQA